MLSVECRQLNGVEGMSLIQSDVEKAATWETLLKTQTFKITAVLQQEALKGCVYVVVVVFFTLKDHPF